MNQVSGILGAGPVILVATADGEKRDVLTIAWHTMLDFEPPKVGIVMGADHYSRVLMNKTRECVIAIPGADLGALVVEAGTSSGRDMDKFAKYAIATRLGTDVSVPLLTDCLYNFECKVVGEVAQYELAIVEVVRAWENPDRTERRTLHHRGGSRFFASGENLDFSSLFSAKK